MAKHKLTADNADLLNVGKGVNPGENSDDHPDFLHEGDSVDTLPLPSGDKLVITGVNESGFVTGVVLAEDDDSGPDETPVKK